MEKRSFLLPAGWFAPAAAAQKDIRNFTDPLNENAARAAMKHSRDLSNDWTAAGTRTNLHVSFVPDDAPIPAANCIPGSKAIYASFPKAQYPLVVNLLAAMVDKAGSKKLLQVPYFEAAPGRSSCTFNSP